MSYQSIDTLQNYLGQTLFSHTSDAKKASGRALGTLVEIITYYLFRSYGFEYDMAIERPLLEYGSSDISHNVEFSLHHVERKHITTVPIKLPLNYKRLLLPLLTDDSSAYRFNNNSLLNRNYLLKNRCKLAESNHTIVLASLVSACENYFEVEVAELQKAPYAMIECKRVGVEEGSKKGPQTIEKAKQGAYVAQKISALQKVRTGDGSYKGIIFIGGNTYIDDYDTIVNRIIYDQKPSLPEGFTLSIGVVSNHGNWFTAENQNKELRVLAGAYDWLLFLTDSGLAEFIETLILNPEDKYIAVQNAFKESYKEGKKINIFTKSQIDFHAHIALSKYFSIHRKDILGWFNVISPKGKTLPTLFDELSRLRNKSERRYR